MKNYLILITVVLLGIESVSAKDIESVVSEGNTRLQENQTSQVVIDKIDDDTQDIIAQYHEKLKIVEGLEIYNVLLAKQLANQEKEMNTLQESIANAAVIERQILPMLSRMVDSIEVFVGLDLPFLLEERQQRIEKLRKLIVAPEVTNAEKARRVFEAFQIENDYGNTIESYKGKLNRDQKTYDVDFLRVGRVAYLYRTIGGDEYGYWSVDNKQWETMDSRVLIRNMDKAIRVARQEIAPELIIIPIEFKGGES